MIYHIHGKGYVLPDITDEEFAAYKKVQRCNDMFDVLSRLEELEEQGSALDEPPSESQIKRAAALYREYQQNSEDFNTDLDDALFDSGLTIR